MSPPDGAQAWVGAGLQPRTRNRQTSRLVATTAKQYVTLEEAVELCRDIGERIMRLSPRPEIVVGLANGGILPAAVAAEAAGLDCRIVPGRRISSRIKRRVRFLSRVLPLLPKAVRSPIRAVMSRIDRSFTQVERDNKDFDFDVVDRHIIIVDDCIDSGASVSQAHSKLLAMGASSVQVAVICWATRFDSRAMHGVAPDIHLHRIIHHFPWALNNPEYPSFRIWLKEQGYGRWA